MVKYSFFRLVKTVCVIPNYGYILLTTYPDHTKIDMSSFVTPKEPHNLFVHEFGAANTGRPIIKVDDIIRPGIDLIGRSIVLTCRGFVSYGVISLRE